MVTLTSLNELVAAKKALDKLQNDHPSLFEKLVEMVNLTRAFHFKYHYMGALIMDEDPGEDTPNFVYGSVLRLYKREIQKLKEDVDFPALKQVFADNKNTDYAKICLLVLGMTPESLVGSTLYK